MLYHAYEMTHAAITPLRAAATAGHQALNHPFNPWGYTPQGRTLAAAFEVFENTTRRYDKPAWGLTATSVAGVKAVVREKIDLTLPFADLLHFERTGEGVAERSDPNVLIVAPMSGHYATLLRGTVDAMLPEHEVFVTGWKDARQVPMSQGTFDLEDYITYIIDFIRHIGPNTHVIAVCQPGPAVIAAVSLMSRFDDPYVPASMIIMGGPVDPRKSPTVPNDLATERPLSWFENNVISRVPWPHAGFMRPVYPGFLQLTGFMTMNLERHYDAHVKLFGNLVEGDGDSVEKHQEFYAEYLSVMDLSAEFYLQTIRDVFQECKLPEGTMTHRGRLVDPRAIKRTALLTVEGEKDDISGIGQTRAAHDICPHIPARRRADYLQPGVGHYGVFNGTRWRSEIQPRVRDFIRSNLNAT